MNKYFERFLNDENVSIQKDNTGMLNVNIQSYNYNTLDNKHKTQRYFEKIKRYKNDVLSLYNVDVFAVSIDSFNIDGLYESNSGLLTDNSVLYCNY